MERSLISTYNQGEKTIERLNNIQVEINKYSAMCRIDPLNTANLRAYLSQIYSLYNEISPIIEDRTILDKLNKIRTWIVEKKIKLKNKDLDLSDGAWMIIDELDAIIRELKILQQKHDMYLPAITKLTVDEKIDDSLNIDKNKKKN